MPEGPRTSISAVEGDDPEPAGAMEVTPLDAGAASRLLAAIVESSDDAILSKTLDGVITSWNEGAVRMYGYRPEEVIGRRVSMLAVSPDRDDTELLLARLRRGERIRHYETTRRGKSGRPLTVSLTISPLFDMGGNVIGASTIARDITARVAEASRWRFLSEVGQATSHALDGEDLLRGLARILVRDLADYCITYLVEDQRIRRIGVAHADPEREALVERLIEVAAPTVEDAIGPGAVIRTGRPVMASEISSELLGRAGDGEYLEILRMLDPVSSIVLPLRARGRTVGAIALATTKRSDRRYGEADLALGREVANRAALALDNSRLYQEARAELRRREAAEHWLRKRYQQLRILYEMTEAVERAGDLGEIYSRALDSLRRGLGVDRASIMLFDPDGTIRFKAWRGLSQEYRRAVEGHSPWASDARDPAPIVVPDVRAADDFDPALRATILAEGIIGLVFIPLVFGGRLLGKFMLYSDAPRRMTEDEVELARTIAGTIAFAISRVRDEQSVLEAKEAAERANEAKSQFLGIMSHELRTPLNAVLGYTELLLLEAKGSINAEQREQLERIEASALHQLELVDELLTYTRLEAGREEPRLIETDARRVVRDVAELMRPAAEAKRLALRVHLPDAPLQLFTDPARLRQIAINLVGNAVKYTGRGEIEIRASREWSELVLAVSDTGAGIPDDRLDYIFEPFARVDESRTRETAGSGLGLAIARRLANLLGGDLSVRSELGSGSTFTLRLPLRGPTPARRDGG